MVALRYGTIPYCARDGRPARFYPRFGRRKGNGFTFRNYNAHEMLGTILRAKEGFEKQDGWRVLVKRAMECDCSWGASARQYVDMYEQVCQLW